MTCRGGSGTRRGTGKAWRTTMQPKPIPTKPRNGNHQGSMPWRAAAKTVSYIETMDGGNPRHSQPKDRQESSQSSRVGGR
jgi:hypothetical protein